MWYNMCIKTVINMIKKLTHLQLQFSYFFEAYDTTYSHLKIRLQWAKTLTHSKAMKLNVILVIISKANFYSKPESKHLIKMCLHHWHSNEGFESKMINNKRTYLQCQACSQQWITVKKPQNFGSMKEFVKIYGVYQNIVYTYKAPKNIMQCISTLLHAAK